MTLRLLRRSLGRLVSEISSDAMLALCFVAPFLAGAAFRLALPLANRLVAERFGLPESVSPFFPLADLFVGFLTGYMVSFASAMVMLEERDNGTASYLAVTPLGRTGYLFSRLIVPLAATVPLTSLVLALFRTSALSLPALIVVSVALVPVSLCVALFVVSFSGNRVEGLALGKLAGLILASLAVPFAVKDPIAYAAGVFPAFWVSDFIVRGSWLSVAAFAACSAAWLVPLWARFTRSRL